MTVQVARRLFTVEEYHKLAEAGILVEDDRVELIDGEIVEMSPIGSRHQACVDWLTRECSGRLRHAAIVRVQGPIRTGDRSEPQPDVALLRPRQDFYAQEHPGPADVLLVIEVADTTADYDRHTKLPLYARAGIPEAWLINFPGGRIEVHREPSPDGYKLVRYVTRGENLAPLSFPDLDLAVDELLG